MAAEISICLVNYNAKELTLACLTSIEEKTARPHEIFLIDNNSSDGSAAAVKEHFSFVNIIENKKNAGFASANNQAIALAKSKYIVLLNNDTVLKNDALDKKATFLDDNPKVGAVTCKLYNADGKTIQRNCRAFPSPFDTMFGRASFFTKLFPNNPISRKNIVSDFGYDTPRQIDWASGAALMVRREVIDRIGLLDEYYFMYWEDTDWCKRINDAGWQVWFIPDAEIIHFTGQGGGRRPLKLKLFTIYNLHYSAYYYFRKFYYKSMFHPMSIMLFCGMVILVATKSIIAVLGFIKFYVMKSYIAFKI